MKCWGCTKTISSIMQPIAISLLTCILFSGCEYYFQQDVCGNNTTEGDELCDGTDLAGEDCTTIDPMHTGGALACGPTCSYWDTSECYSLTGSLSGTLSLGPEIACGDATDDCFGAVHMGIFVDDPEYNPEATLIYSGMIYGRKDWSNNETESYNYGGPQFSDHSCIEYAT